MVDTPQTIGGATLKGTFWNSAAFYSGKTLVFISTLVLARLLTQDDFGVVGFALTTIGFLEMVDDLGINPALIYYPEERNLADTAFWLGLMAGSALCVITLLIAPLVGLFFNDPRAVSVTQVLAFVFPIDALGNAHQALLRKDLAFKKKFIPDMARMTTKGVLSIILALSGFGPWSLILGQLGGVTMAAVMVWQVLPWRPKWHFAYPQARKLLAYGTRSMSANMLWTLMLNVDYLLVGRFLGAAALGVYTLAFRVPELIILNFCHLLSKVLFSTYSKLQNDLPAMRENFLLTMQYMALFTVPVGLGLALVTEPFVLVAFTAKWQNAVPVMRAIALYTVMLSLAYHAPEVYKARGQLGLLNRLTFARVVVLIPVLWATLHYAHDVAAVGWAQVGVAFLGSALNLTLVARELKIAAKQLLAAVTPAFVSATGMALVVVGALWLTAAAPPLAQLVASVLAGGVTYSALLWGLYPKLVQDAFTTIRAMLAKRRN